MDTKTNIETLQHFIGGEWVDAEGGAVVAGGNGTATDVSRPC